MRTAATNELILHPNLLSRRVDLIETAAGGNP
jgi:hypothetical protein